MPKLCACCLALPTSTTTVAGGSFTPGPYSVTEHWETEFPVCQACKNHIDNTRKSIGHVFLFAFAVVPIAVLLAFLIPSQLKYLIYDYPAILIIGDPIIGCVVVWAMCVYARRWLPKSSLAACTCTCIPASIDFRGEGVWEIQFSNPQFAEHFASINGLRLEQAEEKVDTPLQAFSDPNVAKTVWDFSQWSEAINALVLFGFFIFVILFFFLVGFLSGHS